jgi:omega-hydroxy-beta-dihydromenaquinone-9 sulfotransferase
MAETAAKKPSTKVETNHYSLMAARFWHGMPIGALAKLFRMGKYRNVGWLQWPMVGTSWFAAPCNSAMQVIQEKRHGAKIDATPIEEPPLFILGHWRSGTTM